MNKTFSLLALLLIGVVLQAQAETNDFAAAVSAGKITVAFRGNGGSSGDAILATVATATNASDDLLLTVAPGTRLESADSGAQGMVIAGLKGLVAEENGYYRKSEILATSTPQTYVFDAYCTDFEKENPSTNTTFRLRPVDPVLGCLLTEASSIKIKQAAVWIHTDKVTFEHVNRKFKVSKADWEAAQALVRKCSDLKTANRRSDHRD